MPYGNLQADVVQGSVANTPPAFRDGNGTAIGTLCRAWVNFNGTGTVAIRASFNVSSITDNGTGDYTVNFTNAMPDVNYSAVLGGVSRASVEPINVSLGYESADGNTARTYTTTALRIFNKISQVGSTDSNVVSVAIFR